MRKILFALSLLPVMLMAQTYVEADTVWTEDSYGIVKRVDTTTNVATIHYFSRKDHHVMSIQHVVASGEGKGLFKGKQLYFNEDNKVSSMLFYTLVNDERQGKIRNRLASENYLYPDGKMREEVTITYEQRQNFEKKSYVRKCYYPSGQLQYEEIMDDKNQTAVYYTEKGKVTKRPKQKFEMFMTMPEFPGGQGALFQFLTQSVRYPRIARENEIEGRVIVQFVVDKDGSIENVEVVRSGGDPSLDKEAVRVIKAMPKWIPGKQRGKPVRVKYTVPVNFRLK